MIKKINGQTTDFQGIIDKINEIVDNVNGLHDVQPKRPRTLYAVENEAIGEIIFSARGGAYQDRCAAENKAKLLHREKPQFLYKVVEYTLKE